MGCGIGPPGLLEVQPRWPGLPGGMVSGLSRCDSGPVGSGLGSVAGKSEKGVASRTKKQCAHRRL